MGKQFDVVFPLFFVRFLWFSPRRRRFANFKKFALGVWGTPQQAWKGISLSPACTRCRTVIVYKFLGIPIITNLFYYLEKQKKIF